MPGRILTCMKIIPGPRVCTLYNSISDFSALSIFNLRVRGMIYVVGFFKVKFELSYLKDLEHSVGLCMFPA